MGWGHSETLAGEDERAKREETVRRFVSRSARWFGCPLKTRRGGQKQRVTAVGGEKPKKAPTIGRLVRLSNYM